MGGVTASAIISPSVHYFGTPVVLVSTSNSDGSTNLSPISSAWALEQTYVLGMATAGHGTRNALRTGQLVLNLADARMTRAIERIAPTTGAIEVPEHKRDRYRYEPDKWSVAGLTPVRSDLVLPDRVDECPVQHEAEVVSAVPHADGSAVVIQARVLRTHAHVRVVQPGSSYLNLERWQPLYYTFRHYFAQGRRTGRSFKAEQ